LVAHQANPLQDFAASFVAKGVPAISITVVHPDGTVTNAAAGVADENGTPITPEDRFLAGSTGKTFFAAWALQLQAEGKINLDRKFIDYSGDKHLATRIPNGDKVTLRQLMNHTSGVPEHVESEDFIKALKSDAEGRFSAEQLLRFSFDKKPLFVPGKGWSYADTNYILLAYALESATGENAYAEIQRRFLGPLDLAYTEPSTHRRLDRLVTGHMFAGNPFGEGASKKDGKLVLNPQFEWAGGGFVSNPSDLALWMWSLAGGDILDADQKKQMQTGVPARTGPGHQYGLGLQIRPVNGATTIGHSGWYPGYLTDIHYWPNENIAVCVMTATDDQRLIGTSLPQICAQAKALVIP
jgi:D-alanyl-D-alanine carboxypeptidase